MKRIPKVMMMKGSPRVTDGLATGLEGNQLRLGQEDTGPQKGRLQEIMNRRNTLRVIVENEFIIETWKTKQTELTLFFYQ